MEQAVPRGPVPHHGLGRAAGQPLHGTHRRRPVPVHPAAGVRLTVRGYGTKSYTSTLDRILIGRNWFATRVKLIGQ